MAAASIAIGTSVWSMHFIGMLALHIPVEIDFAVVPTIVSFLAAILVAALGLYAGTSGHLGRHAALIG
ncbi:MHYT domain-containing protein, partial [Acinetobacter baumannii]